MYFCDINIVYVSRSLFIEKIGYKMALEICDSLVKFALNCVFILYNIKVYLTT
jgi:hypothetical protein